MEKEEILFLVEQLKKGDDSSVDALISNYSERLYRYCYRILGNEADTEEVLQDVFLKVYKKIDLYQKNTGFSSWIYMIARNTARDKLRGNIKHKNSLSIDGINSDSSSDIDIHFEIQDKRESPLLELQRNELNTEINEILENLPDPYREILFLRHMEDYSYQEMAEILECKVGTIKSRLAKARSLFIEKIKHKSYKY